MNTQAAYNCMRMLCSGPVVATVWEGKGVVVTGRKLVGATNPLASGDPSESSTICPVQYFS